MATERRPFRGWVSVDKPGPRYWRVGMYVWNWREGATGDGYGGVDRCGPFPTVVTETGGIHRDGVWTGLEAGGLEFSKLEDALRDIADRLESILERSRR